MDRCRSCGNKKDFCVLLIAGPLRCRKETIFEMWVTDENFRRAVFTADMAQNRFAHTLQFIRFDDKLTAVHDVWDWFLENCKNLFETFEDITIDE